MIGYYTYRGCFTTYMFIVPAGHASDCLFAYLSIRARTGEAWERFMAAAGTYGCFELAGLFASLLKKKAKRCQYYVSTVEALLSLHKRNIAIEPQKHRNAKKPVANYKQAKVRNCAGVAVLCVP